MYTCRRLFMENKDPVWVSFDEGQTHLSSLYCCLVIFGVHGAHGVRSTFWVGCWWVGWETSKIKQTEQWSIGFRKNTVTRCLDEYYLEPLAPNNVGAGVSRWEDSNQMVPPTSFITGRHKPDPEDRERMSNGRPRVLDVELSFPHT